MEKVQETQARSLGLEDPLEKEVATHSSTFAWEIPWREEPGGLQSMRLQKTEQLNNNNSGSQILAIDWENGYRVTSPYPGRSHCPPGKSSCKETNTAD